MSDYERRYGQGSEMDSLLLELRGFVFQYREECEEAEICEDLRKVLEWIECVYEGDCEAGQRLKEDARTRLETVRDKLKVTGRECMDIGTESPAAEPVQEPDPSAFFEARARLADIIDTLLETFPEAVRK